MTSTESELYDHLEEAVDAVERRDMSWREDMITIDSVPSADFSTARAFHYLATTAALLGATEQAREWFGEEARWYTRSNEGHRLRRDIRQLASWKNEPARSSPALNAAVLSRDESVCREVATVTLELDESYLDVFAEDRPACAAQYFNAKVKAALVIDETQVPDLLERLETYIERFDERSQFWQSIPEYYRGLLTSSSSTTQAAVEDLFEYHADDGGDSTDPRKYVLTSVCAYIVLARRHGIDVSIESDRLPETILREDVPEDDVVLDVDLSGLRLGSPVRMFELERDDEGRPVIAGRMYHPGADPVSAEDVPEREAGRVLSDEWIEAALDEAEWRDHYDEDLVAAARSAYEDGTLRRKLVVVQDRTDGGTFDESLSTLPIDAVDLLKGAGR